jgi:hypothetical protein
VSGLSLVLDTPDRRATIALYMLTRAMYELTTLTAKQQNIESPNHILVALFSLIQVPIMYCLTHAPHCLAPTYLRFICKMGEGATVNNIFVHQNPLDG